MKHIIRMVALVLVVCLLSVNAFAAEKATPSVEQQGGPQVVAPKADADETPAIVVETADGEIIESDDPEVLKVTPLDDSKNLKPEQKEQMEKAYTQISEAESLAEIAPELPEVLKELKIETPAEELVVRDLVHVSISEKLEKALEATEGNGLKVTFKMDLAEGETLIVLVQNEDGEWVIVYGDDIVIEDGEVTVRLPHVGPVAFIVV